MQLSSGAPEARAVATFVLPRLESGGRNAVRGGGSGALARGDRRAGECLQGILELAERSPHAGPQQGDLLHDASGGTAGSRDGGARGRRKETAPRRASLPGAGVAARRSGWPRSRTGSRSRAGFSASSTSFARN
jgi:hypothetical protein